ncbi:MAG: YbgC/FadM family acyl-CoA thioesterase [Zymomonas mobilis subsp. pomaceae]|uniref:Thioesterase superfamily protein n=1 Tax=Zymomonas mobilis subsp. pomaceae (strain ATCC 29192 / DSM 22645 / JCM 10191 / CCUG 17912 / NBRC 13757 / NCIMB 11200 / NRRL B-4491 / Barker I) TaxID=579138 RepID=F8ET35_ZYMMT|nr:YbgC/FadM family acyl-CoA thioesterase [Zymomonas mobilis]AEI37939.1 thioesterase superfamily protein [Zymomonas mobilis subsp. pomaceae ATCC 29192]MDX5949308.1 YbgC/FadM family acyl-CoA thioesterase [Zymomonas mobilis subsp. pomaceae]GEB89685.1 tol-pal system-associated acyl-CoA thioesterase [Zymomonas mobilis subsp. pomaceae]
MSVPMNSLIMDRNISLSADGILKKQTHSFFLTVYYEDTDLSGRVYHANYLRFAERARSDLVKLLGINQRAAYNEGVGMFVIHEQKIRYRQPAWLDDRLEVQTQLTRLKAATVQLQQKIFRDSQLLVETEAVIAFLSVDGRPCRLPSLWRSLFEPLCITDNIGLKGSN